MILITRPKDKALKLESKLSKYGYNCFTEPLSEIKFKNQSFKFQKNHVYLISSPRTVSYIIQKQLKNLNIKLLVIGLSSKDRLQQAGFKNLIYGAKDSEDMIKFLKRSDIQLINYLTGSVRNKNLSIEIKKIGISLVEYIIYVTTFKNSLSRKCISLIKSKKIRQILIYSEANAKHIIMLLNKANIQKDCKSAIFFCLSRKIALILKNHGYSAKYSSFPTEVSLIKKLMNNPTISP